MDVTAEEYGFICKPIDFDDLLNRLRTILQPSSGDRS